MPTDLNPTTPPPPPAPIPLAAAVMLGLVLGIFGYVLFFALAFRRPIDDPIVYLPLAVLAPLAGVVARFAWTHWPAVAACVALPTGFWSLLAYAAGRDGEAGAAAHLGVAFVATACAAAGAFVGGAIGRRRGFGTR